MAMQWLKQPDGTLILWDPAKGSMPLSVDAESRAQAMQGTDTSDVARNLFEDQQGTRPSGLMDLLTKELPSAPESTGDGHADFNAYVNALFAMAAASRGETPDLEGGESLGATTPEGAGYSPASPTTGEETSKPVKTKGYAGAEAFVKGMVKRGWTPEEAAGAAGNVHVESGFRPGVKSSVPGEQSFGFLQWNKDRLQGLKNYASSKGMDWQAPEAQMDWINLERTGRSVDYGGTSEKGAYAKAFAGGGSSKDIAARFGRYVERPKDLSQSVQQRMAAAELYHRFGVMDSPRAQATAVASLGKPQPFSDQTMDEEMFSSILGGASWA